jgi:predicted nuclease of predicted toxin-antitoxin system
VSGKGFPKSRVRLLWDELLSHLVPDALRVLGFNTSYVGHVGDDAPVRGSTDQEVLDHARRTRQTIVTSNHDMMLICAEAGQAFVWLDPRSRQYSRLEQVLIALTQIEQWEALLSADPSNCVRAMRTKCLAIEAAEAARLANQRMRELRRRKARESSKPGPVGTLLPEAP